MSRPTWQSYILRVGGVFATFVAAIMLSTAFLPGSEGFVVIAVSVIGICAVAARELWSKKGSTRSSKRDKSS